MAKELPRRQVATEHPRRRFSILVLVSSALAGVLLTSIHSNRSAISSLRTTGVEHSRDPKTVEPKPARRSARPAAPRHVSSSGVVAGGAAAASGAAASRSTPGDGRAGSASSLPSPSSKTENADGASDQAEVTLIAVMSMQRTSSTYLSDNIMTNYGTGGKVRLPFSICPYHHFDSMDSAFQSDERQSKDIWVTGLGLELTKRGANESEKREIIRNLSGQDLAKVIRQEARKRCSQHMEWDAEKIRAKAYPFNATVGSDITGNVCPEGAHARHHCFINYKHFEEDLQPRQLPGLWSALSPDLVVILDRDVEERWRSTHVAHITQDWNTIGDAAHKERVAAATVPEVPGKFRRQHESWYKLLRGMLQEPSGKCANHSSVEAMLQDPSGCFADLSSVEVTYNEVTKNPVGTRKKIFDALMAANRTNP